MSDLQTRTGRFRAYIQFVAAVLYFFLVRSLAHRISIGIAADQWQPLVEQLLLALLLVVGYAGMGITLDRQIFPIADQGFPLRPGFSRELSLGLASGWAIAVLCVIPVALVGGIAVVLNLGLSAWGWLIADAAFLALWALVEEVAFRGYAFQRFESAVGPVGASTGFAAYYAIVQMLVPGSNRISFAVAFVFGLLLSAAYIRTRALWLSWGLNFGWKASQALIFGLAIGGMSSFSPVVQGNPTGPFWITGGGFGLQSSWVTLVVMLAALPVIFRVTRDLNFKYNVPVFFPGGLAVDIGAHTRAQHEAAMGSAQPSPSPLVQIESGTRPAPLPEQGTGEAVQAPGSRSSK